MSMSRKDYEAIAEAFQNVRTNHLSLDDDAFHQRESAWRDCVEAIADVMQRCPVREWVAAVDRSGHAITRVGSRPWAHYVIGCGVQHDDAEFADQRKSHAAWLENIGGYKYQSTTC